VNLTEEQKKLLKKFDAALQGGGDRHSPRSRSWLDSVKTFFEKMGA
jgi:molecular chaperone DnaJ